MPIYEYEVFGEKEGCSHCRNGFELFQPLREAPLSICPACGQGVKRVISWCRALVVETPTEQAVVEKKVRDYEQSRMWSHAAELADKHAAKTGDGELRMRALDNYGRAGYDAETLDRHARAAEKPDPVNARQAEDPKRRG